MRFFLSFILLLLWMPAGAQSGRFLINSRHLNVENGLAQREVLSVWEDTRGFMWAGTRAGLNFFDGQAFSHISGPTTAFRFDTIREMAEDDQGWLWLFNEVAGKGSLACCPLQGGTIRPFEERFDKAPFEAASVKMILGQRGEKVIVVLKGETLWCFENGGFYPIGLPPGWAVVRLLHSGRLLCVRDGAFAVFDEKGQWLENLPDPGRPVYEYVEYGAGKWLVLTMDGHLHIVKQMPSTAPQWRYDIFRLFRDLDIIPAAKLTVNPENGAIFIANWVNLTILAPLNDDGTTATVLRSETFDRHVRQVLFDRRGTAWVATENGIRLIRMQPSFFSRFPAPDTLLRRMNFRGMAEGSGGVLYAALENATLVACDPLGRTCKPVNLNLKAWSLTAETDGRVWIAGNKLGLYKPGKGLEQGIAGPPGNDTLQIWSMARRKNGRWWLGSEGGLYEADAENGSRLRLAAQFGAQPVLNKARILQITPAETDRWWLATNAGLFKIDEVTNVAERYWPGGQGRFYLPSANIQFVHCDTEGVYWLATADQGLLRWQPASGVCQAFTRREGMSSNNLYAIFEDSHAGLWISSANGIIRFDKKRFSSQAFLPADGTSHYEFNRIAYCRASDGCIYFGSLDGITAFYPDEFYNDTAYAVPLKIVRMQRYDTRQGRLIDVSPVPEPYSVLELPAESRIFTVTLSLQDYFYAPAIVYEYLLDQDREWIPVTGNEVRLSGLSYGGHVLQLRARGARGQYSTSQITLPLHVAWPFYLRWWFLGGSVALLAGGTGFLLHRRTRKFLQRQQELERLVQERTEELAADKRLIEEQAAGLRHLDETKSRFFANISHELRTPLTLITGPVEHLLQPPSKLPEAASETLRRVLRNSGKLLGLVEELLELSRLDAGQVRLHKEPVVLQTWCNRIFAAFQPQAHWKGVDFTLQWNLPETLTLNIDGGRLEKIVNNLLINALQHTSRGQSLLWIISRNETNIRMEVRDTGTGIHPDDLPHVFERYYQSRRAEHRSVGGAGIGLALARELAGVLDGSLTVQSTWGEGSVFILLFPEEKAEMPPQELPPVAFMPDNPPASNLLPTGSKATLLIVEDNADMQEHLRELLGQTYHLLPAADGRQAWDWLELNGPEVADIRLILSDVMMPQMDGFELLDRAKRHARWRHLPFVMLTARSDEQDKLQALRLGVDDYLTKPFSAAELHVRVANLLARTARRPLLPPGEDPEMASADERWLQEIAVVARRVLEEKKPLSVSYLAQALHLSERSLQRKIKDLTGLSPAQYLLECRLDRARYLLEQRVFTTMREVAFAVGFETPHYFSSVYEKRFGRTPSSYFTKE